MFQTEDNRPRPTPAEFFMFAVRNNFKSKEANRPIFEEKEFIRFFMPGGGTWEREVKPKDIQERPKQYQAFKDNQEQIDDGTPLNMWVLLNKAQVEELKALGIRTVEELAEASEAILQGGLGIRKLQGKASSWLKATKQKAFATKLTDELEKRDEEIEMLKKQISKLQQTFDASAVAADSQ